MALIRTGVTLRGYIQASMAQVTTILVRPLARSPSGHGRSCHLFRPVDTGSIFSIRLDLVVRVKIATC